MGSMYERVVGVISKPPTNRSLAQVQDLLPWFRKKSELFASLETDVVTDIVRNCEFCTRHRDDIIIKQGDKGDCFYTILRGKVSIFINNAISDEEDESLVAAKSREAGNISRDEKGELDRAKFGNYIAPLEAGKSFGELALISKECVRNASIIADDVTDLLVVNRELYNRSLRQAQQAEYEERTNFVAENPLFRSWQPKYKRQMAMSIRKEIVQFDAKIVRQGDRADVLYFLLRGQAKLSVDPVLHVTQFPHACAYDDAGADVSLLPPVVQEPGRTANDKPGSVAPSACRKKETKRKQIEISLVGNNDVIGDVEFALDLKTYMQSATCTQACHVYALDMKNYERLVIKRNPKTVDVIRETAEVKLLSRVSRLHDNQVPLLRALYYKLALINRPELGRKKDPRMSSPAFVDHMDIIPQRGALIDQYGPGTIFYRIRMRERAKNRVKNKSDNFRGAKGGFGFTSSVNNTNPTDAHQGAPNHHMTSFLEQGDGTHAHGEDQADEDRFGSRSDMEEDMDDGDRPFYRDSFTDWASSNRVLADLEDRITHWHAAVWTGRRAAQPSAVPLRRVNLQDGQEVRPGQKVVLRKKRLQPNLVVTSFSDGDEDGPLPQTALLPRGRTLSDDVMHGHPDAADGQPCTLEEGPVTHAHRLSPLPQPRLVFHLHKNQPLRQYTAEEYKELKKMLLWRQRSMAFPSLG